MEQINDKIKSIKWQFSWSRRMTYQKMRLFSYAYQHAIPKMFGVSLSSELYRVENFTVSECYDFDEYKTAFSKIEERFADRDSIKLFSELSKLIRSFEDVFKVYIEKMPTSYDLATNEDLLASYLNYCEVEKNISLPNWVLFVPFEEIITKTLIKSLEKELDNPTKAEQIIKNVSLPYKMTPLDAHNKALYEIALTPQDKKDDMLNELLNKYIHWGTFDVIYPESTRESFAKKLAEIEGLDVGKLINELDEKYKSQTKVYNETLKEWEGHPYIYALLNLYSHYANYKDWKNYYREQSSYKLKILLNEISKRINLSLEQTAFLTEEETLLALRDNFHFDANEIENRIKNCAFVFLEKKLYIITNNDDLAKIDETIAISKSIKEVKGTGAYLGRVVGVARIIISSNDFSKVKDGDILITSTTRPDYVPIMKKTAAFVTNEGGLLSHAAIVARELKKPCVIGTKIATQVFKDGDLVEVDANTGIVKIIKQNGK